MQKSEFIDYIDTLSVDEMIEIYQWVDMWFRVIAEMEVLKDPKATKKDGSYNDEHIAKHKLLRLYDNNHLPQFSNNK